MIVTASETWRALSSKIVHRGEWAGIGPRMCCAAALISCSFRLRGAPASDPQLQGGICTEFEWVLLQIAQKGLCDYDKILHLKCLCCPETGFEERLAKLYSPAGNYSSHNVRTPVEVSPPLYPRLSGKRTQYASHTVCGFKPQLTTM